MMRPIDADALMEAIQTDIMGGLNYESFIKEAPTINDAPCWIPCEERLPEECETVLVTCKSDIEFGMYRKARNEWAIWEDSRWIWGMDVTAWMPLPEPYGGERKDDD